MFWLKAKENPEILKNVDTSSSNLFKHIRIYKEFLGVHDKEDAFEEFKADLTSQLITDNKIKDANILLYFEELFKEFKKEDILQFLTIVISYILEDRVISIQEQESLKIFGTKFSISDEEIHHLIDKKQKNRKGKSQASHYAVKSGKYKYLLAISVIVGILLMLSTGVGIYHYILAKNAFNDFSLKRYIEQNPKLVFKTIYFNKYIIQGKPQGTDSHFDKLYIFFVKGYADFQYDMTKLKINIEKTDAIAKTLYLNYIGSEFPIEIDINVPQSNVYKLEEIQAQPVSESEAKVLGKIAAVPAGILGLLLGSKIGASIGGNLVKIPIAGRLIGGLIGGGVAGGAAAGTAYIVTRNFMRGIQFTNSSLAEQDQLLNAAKPLIALELMGGSLLSEDSWDYDIKKYYQNEFEIELKNIFSKYGWLDVKIEYIGS